MSKEKIKPQELDQFVAKISAGSYTMAEKRMILSRVREALDAADVSPKDKWDGLQYAGAQIWITGAIAGTSGY